MTEAGLPGGPGAGTVIVGLVVGALLSLGFGVLVAAVLNAWLAVDWVRGIASLAVAALLVAALLRAVVQTARGRLGALRGTRKE